ncbi:MAG: glucuronosyltransferase [Nostocaceae cyanobacterium]|nr:glucuronosyltransferase [Nostocaceae cyanobacterium]
MKSVVLITGHYWNSQRKAGFHWLADALWRQGWEVIFMTASLSWLSVIRQDYRLAYPVFREANQLIQVDKWMWSYVWFTPWHPANLRSDFLNKLSKSLFRTYNKLPLGAVESKVRTADLFIFESTPALLLFERFKHLNPNARFVYRVSDDLRLLRNHPVVLETEERIAPQFDLVSVPSQTIYRLFAGLPQLKLHLHGIHKDLFAQQYTNPYPASDNPNLIFVGNSYFDREFLKQASQLFPDWYFHIIGPLKDLPQRKNITSYGELPFQATIPYIKYADIALQTRSYSPGVESLTDSLKVIQYTYCRLPIISPAYLSSPRTHIFYYQPGDTNSIKTALISARNYDCSQIQTDDIYSWDELVSQLLG